MDQQIQISFSSTNLHFHMYQSMYGIGYYEEVYDVDDDGDQGVISMG